MPRDPLRLFVPSRQQSPWLNALKTAIQTATLWLVFLLLIPILLIQLHSVLGIARWEPGWSRWLAFALFWIFGGLGFFCGYIFVKHGRGTPFPLDQTTQFVVMGPYRFVRNPMALLGILQGVTVAWWLGSLLVLIYALAGGTAWHLFARPYEEEDLRQRFGGPYEDYCKHVRNWLPSLRKYKLVSGATSNHEGHLAETGGEVNPQSQSYRA